MQHGDLIEKDHLRQIFEDLKIKSEIVKIYGEESKDIKYHELLARVDYIIKLYYL